MIEGVVSECSLMCCCPNAMVVGPLLDKPFLPWFPVTIGSRRMHAKATWYSNDSCIHAFLTHTGSAFYDGYEQSRNLWDCDNACISYILHRRFRRTRYYRTWYQVAESRTFRTSVGRVPVHIPGTTPFGITVSIHFGVKK